MILGTQSTSGLLSSSPPLMGQGEARATTSAFTSFVVTQDTVVSAPGVNAGSGRFASLQQVKESFQQQALADRAEKSRLVEMERLMQDMRSNLQAIVKNYPPFPQGSEERERYLSLITGIRKQMEAMMIPPPDSAAAPWVAAMRQMGMPPALDGTTSDAELAQVVQRLDQAIAMAQGFGEEIRQRWLSGSRIADDPAISAMSVQTGRSLAALNQGLTASMQAL